MRAPRAARPRPTTQRKVASSAFWASILAFWASNLAFWASNLAFWASNLASILMF